MLKIPYDFNFTLMSDMDPGKILLVDYTNWRGKRRWRPIIPVGLLWDMNPHYHSEPQWLLDALDLEDHAYLKVQKLFALRNVHEVRTFLDESRAELHEVVSPSRVETHDVHPGLA